jgi:hypothetical protein
VAGSADEPSYGAGIPVPEKMNKYQYTNKPYRKYRKIDPVNHFLN